MQPGEGVVRVLEREQRAPHVDQQQLAGAGQTRGLAATAEQGQTDCLFEFLDLQRDRRWGEVQLGSGTRETLVSGDRGEGAQLTQTRSAHYIRTVVIIMLVRADEYINNSNDGQ